MSSDKAIGGFILGMLILLGFAIDKEISMSTSTRDAVLHLVDAIDEVQDLAFNDAIEMDKSIEIREDIVEIIRRLEESKIR